MAFDISTGGAAPDAPLTGTTFDDFVALHGEEIERAVILACGRLDGELARQASAAGLVRTAQRWSRTESHGNIAGATFRAAVDHAGKVVTERGPVSMNEATGGYVRGLPLSQAVEALPLLQRAGLVAAHYLNWSDAHTAVGFGEDIGAVKTRRTRAESFIARHLRVENSEAAELVAELLAHQAEEIEVQATSARDIRRSARRRTVRNRVGVCAAAIALIAGGAGLVEVTSRDLTPTVEGPQAVDAPSTSNDWFAPVPDGAGGFTALNIAGSSSFSTSHDGIEWFDAATWNSRAIDLRSEVTGFIRDGDRYIATVEGVDAVGSRVPPRIATSVDLRDWKVADIEIALPDDVDGLRSQARVIKVVDAGDKLLVAVEIEEIVDHAALGIGRQDVCVEVEREATRELHLCDGAVVNLSRSIEQATKTVYALSVSGGAFETVRLPIGSDAASLVGFESSFVVADEVTGQLSLSGDGRTWTAQDDLPADRFALVNGRDSQALVVQPSSSGWTSAIFTIDGRSSWATLGLDLDPVSVWTKPQLASGPAGWALFVTTSRPWERADATPGWAVETGNWIVSRQPDADTVTARDQLGQVTYRLSIGSNAVETGEDGSITLVLPGVATQVEITSDEIARSRSGDIDGQVKAQVFFTEDGQSWRSIWETAEETWFGSIAVGDSEVLISGTTLMGPPISVPLE